MADTLFRSCLVLTKHHDERVCSLPPVQDLLTATHSVVHVAEAALNAHPARSPHPLGPALRLSHNSGLVLLCHKPLRFPSAGGIMG
jgi:hypothetical protein